MWFSWEKICCAVWVNIMAMVDSDSCCSVFGGDDEQGRAVGCGGSTNRSPTRRSRYLGLGRWGSRLNGGKKIGILVFFTFDFEGGKKNTINGSGKSQLILQIIKQNLTSGKSSN